MCLCYGSRVEFIRRVNAVDVLFAAFPAFLYMNPDLGRYLLKPLLESQVSNGVPIGQAYAPQNLGLSITPYCNKYVRFLCCCAGVSFPNISSNLAAHNFGIERNYTLVDSIDTMD